MNNRIFFKTGVFLLILLAGLFSCREEWDEHYHAVISEKSDLNLYDYISTQPDLTKFTQMLKITGYDTILSQNQTYTVWAPKDESLEGFDLTDIDLVNKTVKNHISRFTTTTSGRDSLLLNMLNGKLLVLKRNNEEFSLQGKKISKLNIAVKNGMIHVLDAYVPYVFNIWEYLFRANGIDSLRNYVNSLTRNELDVEKSFLDGVLIDSIFKQSNKVLTRLALLNKEDSVYTALLPENAVWKSTYDKVLPYFKTLEVDGGVTAQISNTKWTMVKDLFFSGKKMLPLLKDSVYSTYGTVLTNGSQLFPATNPVVMSNGLSYVTGSFNFKPEDSWHKKITVEAESATGRVSGNYEVVTYSSIGSPLVVSRRSYLFLRDISTLSSSRLFATFQIPNTLSAKYNIYCVTVPTAISDSNDVRPFKMKFSLVYDYVQGVKRDSVWFTETGTTKSVNQAKAFTSLPKEVSKILVVKNYTFPWSNLIRSGNTTSDFITGSKVRVFLRVENAAGTTPSEKLNFNRNLRIDCLILEPVE